MLYQSINPHGGDVYAEPIRLDFSANTNPFGTPPGIIRAVERSLSAMHRYPDPYCRELVEAIADFEQVPKEYILCGNGAAELIYTYCDGLKPAHAVELAPTFSEYSLGLQRIGCTVSRYRLDEKQEFALTSDFLDFLRQERPDAVFLCNPNNPTGQLISQELLREILAFCRETNCHLLIDECFLDLTEGGKSLKPYLADDPQLLILKAFTKSYGMAGIRLGYCLSGNQELLRKMAASVQPWNVSSLAQAAGIAALQEKEFLQKTKDLILTERQWLRQELENLGFRVCPGQANFLLFQGKKGLDRQLRELGISIRSCDNYHGLGKGWYRIAVRLHEENEILIQEITKLTERN